MKIDTKNLYLLGLLQAVGIVLYVAIATGFLRLIGHYFSGDPGYLGVILMLLLLVISAAITGAIVFGYSAYLAFNWKTTDAIKLFGFTILYCIGFAMLILVFLALL
jgi:hypothetical protein